MLASLCVSFGGVAGLEGRGEGRCLARSTRSWIIHDAKARSKGTERLARRNRNKKNHRFTADLAYGGACGGQNPERGEV